MKLGLGLKGALAGLVVGIATDVIVVLALPLLGALGLVFLGITEWILVVPLEIVGKFITTPPLFNTGGWWTGFYPTSLGWLVNVLGWMIIGGVVGFVLERYEAGIKWPLYALFIIVIASAFFIV